MEYICSAMTEQKKERHNDKLKVNRTKWKPFLQNYKLNLKMNMKVYKKC